MCHPTEGKAFSNLLNLHQGRFEIHIRKKFTTEKEVGHWNWLVHSGRITIPGRLKKSVDAALGDMVLW